MAQSPHLGPPGIPLTATLEKLADFQVAKVSIGAPAGCPIYHDTDVPGIREGDVLSILTQLHEDIGPVVSCVDQ